VTGSTRTCGCIHPDARWLGVTYTYPQKSVHERIGIGCSRSALSIPTTHRYASLGPRLRLLSDVFSNSRNMRSLMAFNDATDHNLTMCMGATDHNLTTRLKRRQNRLTRYRASAAPILGHRAKSFSFAWALSSLSRVETHYPHLGIPGRSSPGSISNPLSGTDRRPCSRFRPDRPNR